MYIKITIIYLKFPKLAVSVTLKEDFITSLFLIIIEYLPRLNSNEPSDEFAVLSAVILYTPLEFTKIIETSSPPLITFL